MTRPTISQSPISVFTRPPERCLRTQKHAMARATRQSDRVSLMSYSTTRVDHSLRGPVCRLKCKASTFHDSIPHFRIPPRNVVSVYRQVKRSPLNDVHHVAEHVMGPIRVDSRIDSNLRNDGSERRKSAPQEILLLPATVRWMSTLPAEFQPVAIVATFPRIANELAALWGIPDALPSYLSDLLVDTRGGRRGFPVRILRELHSLRACYVGLHPERSDLWSRPRVK